MKHRETHPTLDVAGCFGCKIAHVHFGAVPGTDSSRAVTHGTQVEKNLNRYRSMKQHGVQPEGTTAEAMDRTDYKQGLWEKRESDIRDYNTPKDVASIKRTLVGE